MTKTQKRIREYIECSDCKTEINICGGCESCFIIPQEIICHNPHLPEKHYCLNCKEISEFRHLPLKEQWKKAKTMKDVDWCCEHCGEIVDGGKTPEREFMGERCCGNCDGQLTRRTNGGQGDPFYWIPKPKKKGNKNAKIY